MLSTRSNRLGFTFLEIVVAVAITAIIGGTVYTTLGGARDRQRVDESYTILRDITRAIDRFDSATASGTLVNGRHPRSIVQLNDSVIVTQTANCTRCRNACDVAYVAANSTGWNATGPYFQNRQITPGTGFRLPIGLVRDSLIRVPAGAPASQGLTYGLLQVRIDSVDYLDAVDLKKIVDALPTDSSKGVVRWTTDAVDGVLLSIFWTLPLAGC